MKNPLLYRSARPKSDREVRKRFLMAPLARTQSERRRRLALAGGFRLLRLSGIDRLDAPGTRRRAGWQAQMAEDLVDHRRIFDACPERVEGAAIIFKAPPQLGQCSISPCRHRACRDRNGGVNPRNASRVRQLWSAVWRIEFAGGLAGLLWLLAWAGSKVLNPTRIDWLISGGDWSQHLMGWLFFRNESPGLPLSRLDNLLYAVGTNIGYTDSIPWISLLLRPFSFLLPTDFQFIGLWLALCFFLQGACGTWLASAFTGDRVARLCSGLLFATAPVLFYRVVHDSLCAHWMIVALLGLHLRPAFGSAAVKRHVSAATGLTLLSSMTHPYLALMVFGLTVALLVKLVLIDRSLHWKHAVFAGVSCAIASMLFFVALGYFSGGVSTGSGGFNTLNADMLAFFNPNGTSRFLPNVPGMVITNEGFAYLGLGGIALVVLACMLLVGTDRWMLPLHRVWPVGVVALGFAFYALGPTPKIANVPVVRLKGIYAKLGFFTAPFRSEGRFFGSSIMPFSLRPSLSFYAYGNGDPGLRPRHCCLRVLYS